MDVQVTPAELLDAIRGEFPREYEIAALRLANGKLADRVAELQSGESSDGTADAPRLAGAGHGHSHPHD